MSGGPEGAARPRAGRSLAHLIDVPILPNAPERDEWNEIERGFGALASEDLWISLLDRLRGVDQSRQQFAACKRYFECALAGALRPVTRHLGPPANVEDALDALPALTALHVTNSNDYMPAVLLARALIEIGWAVRGTRPPSETPREAIDAAARHFERAEAAIEAFDPIEENSPMLADTRYRLAPGVSGGPDFLRDWYEDWADLDPSNPQTLVTHSLFLMPDWYGDFDEIEREARRAVSRAADGLGSGAYPYFWRAPLEAAPSALGKIDAELFLEGIHSLLDATRSQYLANDFAALLYRLSRAPEAKPQESAARTASVRERLREGFGEVARRHLQELHAPIWGLDEAGIRLALSDAFRDEIAAGLVVRPATRGLKATAPGPR